MKSVLGMGDFFFRSESPEELALWYSNHLGVAEVPADYETPSWQQSAGPTVFAPFPSDTDYFRNPQKQWMINFRVDNLNELVADLREKGIAVEVDEETYPNGRFARLADPEGNPIQLWEPAGLDRDD